MAKRNKKEQERLKIDYVVNKYKESKDYYKDLRANFSKWDDMYFNTPGPKQNTWMSNLVVPATHKSIMTLASRVMNHTTATDPSFDVAPSNLALSNLIRSQLYRGDYYSQFFLFVLQELIRGTSIAKVTCQKRTKTRFTLEKVI